MIAKEFLANDKINLECGLDVVKEKCLKQPSIGLNTIIYSRFCAAQQKHSLYFIQYGIIRLRAID